MVNLRLMLELCLGYRVLMGLFGIVRIRVAATG